MIREVFIRRVGFKELILEEWVGVGKGKGVTAGETVLRGSGVSAWSAWHRVCPHLQCHVRKEEEGAWMGVNVRGTSGFSVSRSSRILHILALQLLSFFHNLGLILYVHDLYVMLIIER